MKKMIFILTASVFCLQITGLSQKARVGFSGGIGFSNIHVKDNGLNQSYNSKTGYTAGLIIDCPIGKKFGFYPTLHYIKKGFVQKLTNTGSIGGQEEKTTVVLNYAEGAFNFIYNMKGNKGNPFVGAGPAISFGLPGSKAIDESGGLETETEVNFGKEATDDLKGIDGGANFILGYKFSCGILFSFNYTLGLLNLAPEGSTGKIRNTSFGIRLGYLVKNSK